MRRWRWRLIAKRYNIDDNDAFENGLGDDDDNKTGHRDDNNKTRYRNGHDHDAA